jgi:solute carrier family 10 (sodium/bile acid cotransporter), member 7
VLLPVILGFLLHSKLGIFAERNKRYLKLFDQCIILIIVYSSFSQSFAQNIFRNIQLPTILILSFSMLFLFFFVFLTIKKISELLKFKEEDKITAIFCGSKKSLVHGTVMSKIILVGNDAIGLILLPLMFYHALQLMAAAIITQRWSRRDE